MKQTTAKLSILIILMFLIFNFSCAQSSRTRAEQNANTEETENSNLENETQESAQKGFVLRYKLIPENPRLGEPITIGINTNAKEAILLLNDRQASKSQFFFIPGQDENGGFFATIITIPTTTAARAGTIRLQNYNGVIVEIPITIEDRSFPSQTIHLNPVNTGIRTDPSPERQQQANRLWQILASTGTEIYHTGQFILPLTFTDSYPEFRTSDFGYRRIFVHSTGATDTSVHFGVDFRAPTGTPVRACGRGRVVLSENRIVTGYTVVLEHAPAIYSLYYHLDSLNVEVGQIAEIGQLIGMSGSTGLSTGPHLHWELRVSTENTDPDAFVARPIIDKDLFFSYLLN